MRRLIDGWLRNSEQLLNGPCPICNGIEGCSHSAEERLRAAHHSKEPINEQR
jgi:hypothetical protein